jgi:hypothetical protein
VVSTTKWEQYYGFISVHKSNEGTRHVKKLLPVIIIGTLISGGFAIANQSDKKEIPRPESLNKPGQIETYTGTPKVTEFQFPDNSGKTERQLIKKERTIGQLKPGYNLKHIKLFKYSDYLETKRKRDGTVLENLQVHPNRLIWVAEIDAPQGIEIAQNSGEKFKYKKSTIHVVVDAETGTPFDFDVAEY